MNTTTKPPFCFDPDCDLVEMVCPVPGCEGVPHMMGTIFGRAIPGPGMSGPGLVIESCCESGHHWQTIFADHSGSTWISVARLPDFPEEEPFH